MKAHRYLMAAIGLLVVSSLSACYRLVPPPNHVQAVVILTDGNAPEFFYWPQIAKERELRRKHYYLSGVEVREANCPGPRCDRLVWNTRSDAVWSRSQPAADLVPLPESIRYGEEIPGIQTTIPAETLKPDATYSVTIGIMGLDKKYENKIYFSANAKLAGVGYAK